MCRHVESGEQNADRVDDEERGEHQKSVDGDLRLSATDFILREEIPDALVAEYRKLYQENKERLV